tara:strand:- start:123 stop:890 length:768 start_codon:yes stop_codon:yes gene_type:complete
MDSLLNIIKNSFVGKRWVTVIEKIYLRFFNYKGSISHFENMEWINKNMIDYNEFLAKIDVDLYNKSKQKYKDFLIKYDGLIKKYRPILGGGGIFPLLYFLIIKKKPINALETGVAAGTSSQAILSALEVNGSGHLYSSDLPLFRISKPENYIGIFVDDELKHRWSLFIEGDKFNFYKIFKKEIKIDFLHYDSDKRYFSRKHTMNFLQKYLNVNAIVVMDDIQDNSFFFDYVKLNKINNFRIFKFENKYVGLIGNI